MDFTVAFSLLQDGLTNGAAYGLIALALVLAFSVTRVIMVQAGEFVSFGALTIYTLQNGQTPMTVWFMLAACCVAGVMELIRLRCAHAPAARYLRPVVWWVAVPAVIAAVTVAVPKAHAPMALQVLLTLAIVVPIGSAMYRVVYQPIANASILVLLIVSVATHFVLDGLALAAFGPDGARTAAFTDTRFEVAGQSVALQNLLVLVASAALMGMLYWFSQKTAHGRALRATASNRRGALLMGISADMAGLTSFGLTALICAIAGILIAPFVTIYYNSGFLVSLKAFVGATVGAMVSYPLAALGALSIGVFESFAAFWSSGYKDALVFALMVPILLGCSMFSSHVIDEEEEKAGGGMRTVPRFIKALRDAAWRVPGKLWLIALLVFIAVLPFGLSHYYVTLTSYIYLYAIVCLGVILLTGVAGQVSFGQAAFVGVGAYASAVLTKAWLISPWLALPLVLLATALCSWILGAVTLRMRSHYLPIATIAWAVSIFYVFSNTDSIGASTGMTDLPPIPLPTFGFVQSYELRIYYLVALVLVILALASRNLLDSRTGRAIRSLKSKALMAESMGVNVPLLKIKVFVLAAVLAGISGWLYAHMQRFINPSSFGLEMGVQYIFTAVIGGIGQLSGAIVGSAVVGVISDWLQSILQMNVLQKFGNLQQVIFGVLIVLLLQRTQHGIAYLFTAFIRPRKVPEGGDALSTMYAGPTPEAGKPLLRVNRATKRFGGLTAVSDVSFDVAPGEIMAMIGPNGAGKSTMFNLISGALKPTSGEIIFAGKRINDLTSHSIADTGLSRTFQHVKLLGELSAIDNAALGAYRHGRCGMLATMLRLDRHEERQAMEAAATALERTGLAEVANQPAGSLPLGKQRILEVARALVARPQMLLLDEPAAGLRASEKDELAELLKRLQSEGMTILLVEHDMAFVMNLADRVIVQNFGCTLTIGTPAQVQSHPDVIAAYLGGVAS